MNAIKFSLFGKFRIEVSDNVIQKIEPRKAEELLVYLLLYRDQPQSREQLADILWREIAPEHSKAYLRKSLWQLQTILDVYGVQDMLLVDGEWLQVNPHFDFWLDIKVIEEAFRNAQGIRGKDLEKGQAKSIKGAVEIYRGELLQGWYEDWCLYERERLQFMYLAMLDKLMDHCEANEDYENGLIFGDRILQYDQARERTHRRLMRLFYLQGDRTAALRQYQKCVAALKEELDVKPADRTRLLFEMLRADKLENPSQSNRVYENNNTEPADEPLGMLFSHLNALHKSLSQIQTQIAQDIKVIQRTIKKNQY